MVLGLSTVVSERQCHSTHHTGAMRQASQHATTVPKQRRIEGGVDIGFGAGAVGAHPVARFDAIV